MQHVINNKLFTPKIVFVWNQFIVSFEIPANLSAAVNITGKQLSEENTVYYDFNIILNMIFKMT